jgi:hypothetical protein
MLDRILQRFSGQQCSVATNLDAQAAARLDVPPRTSTRNVIMARKNLAYPEYVVPKSSPTINRSFKGAGSRIGPEIASVEDVGV